MQSNIDAPEARLRQQSAVKPAFPEPKIVVKIGAGAGLSRMADPQVSGSLQHFGGSAGAATAARPRDFGRTAFTLDRTKASLQPTPEWNTEQGASLSWLGDTQARGGFRLLASFLGKVLSIRETLAIVLLIDQSNGEQIESQCDTEVLSANGIGLGDEFECKVIRQFGATSTRLTKLPPKVAPKTRLEEVRSEFKNRWAF